MKISYTSLKRDLNFNKDINKTAKYSLFVDYYATYNGYFIKPIHIIKDLVFIFRLRKYAYF